VEVYFGDARFTGPSTVEVCGSFRSAACIPRTPGDESLALQNAGSASLSPLAELGVQAGERRTLAFRRAVIATGGRPAVPPLPGLSTVAYLTNETLFSLTELPPRLAVIGAGPIGREIAQALARLGRGGTLLEGAPQGPPRE